MERKISVLSIPKNFIFEFGPKVKVSNNQVFLLTQSSCAFVNQRPVRPGHVLVSPRILYKKIVDIPQSLFDNILMEVQLVSKMMELQYRTTVEVAIQDGAVAGQSIPHLHFHIIPKYKESSDIGKSEFDEAKTRSSDDMWQECQNYRDFYDENKQRLQHDL